LFVLLVNDVNLAEANAVQIQQMDTQKDKHTIKDDVTRLLNLFKDPIAQCPRTNLYGILSRSQLDTHKSSGEQSEVANPLSYLAELFNDYLEFYPQNFMVQYVSAHQNQMHVKK
jgi:hypothetical protein